MTDINAQERLISLQVTIVTSAFSNSAYSDDLAQINIIKVGTWIPQTIYGFFYDFFYFVRSIYTTLSLILQYKQPTPASPLLFCETSAAMIPFIKYVTDFKILFFQVPYLVLTYLIHININSFFLVQF